MIKDVDGHDDDNVGRDEYSGLPKEDQSLRGVTYSKDKLTPKYLSQEKEEQPEIQQVEIECSGSVPSAFEQ